MRTLEQQIRDDQLFDRHIRALGTIAWFLGLKRNQGVCFRNGKVHIFTLRD